MCLPSEIWLWLGPGRSKLLGTTRLHWGAVMHVHPTFVKGRSPFREVNDGPARQTINFSLPYIHVLPSPYFTLSGEGRPSSYPSSPLTSSPTFVELTAPLVTYFPTYIPPYCNRLKSYLTERVLDLHVFEPVLGSGGLHRGRHDAVGCSSALDRRCHVQCM